MKKTVQFSIWVIAICGIGIGIWIGFKGLINQFKSTDTLFITSTVTASATILVGLGAVLITQNRIKKREIEEAHRESKIELYNRFNDFLVKLISGENKKVTGNKISEQKMIDFMVKFKKDLMFRASPKVIKAMLEFEIKSNEGKLNILIFMDNLLLSMRKDIGLSNKGLNNHELIQTFLKDKSEINKIK